MANHLRGKESASYKHGMRNTPEFNSWSHMIQRCTNPKNKSWKHYGKRGITICDEWKDDFMAFYTHIGPKPSQELTIERLDNDKGYEPGNVKWGTRSEQSLNRRPYTHRNLKKHCPHGHEYSPENTLTMKNGARRCKTCTQAQRKERWRTDSGKSLPGS